MTEQIKTCSYCCDYCSFLLYLLNAKIDLITKEDERNVQSI